MKPCDVNRADLSAMETILRMVERKYAKARRKKGQNLPPSFSL
jgi:hypothetical protein